MADNVSFKVFLKDLENGGENEVRRFVVDRDVSTSFSYLEEKLCSVFPQLKQKIFSVSWTDEDGDMVTIAMDEELIIALTEMPGPVYKLVVNVKSQKKSENTKTNPQQNLHIHPGVSCDACDKTPGGDYHRGNDDRLDDEQYDNRPINLSKAVNLKRDDQVDSTRDNRNTRDQMNEVGSSVALSTPHSSYLASSQPHLSSQPELLRKSRSHPDPVSSHILDTSVGLPAKGVSVSMYKMGGEQSWTKLQSKVTNDDGRASNFLSWEEFQPGTYKMHFSTGQYFKDRATETFYPYAEVVFEIKDPETHYHIPLLLNPYGYSTYRGS